MSGLGNYAGASSSLAQELIDSLSEEEIQGLYDSLHGQRVLEWIRWRHKNRLVVAQFVAETPSQRKRKKKYRGHIPHLTLAGAQHCMEASALLTVIHQNLLVPGGSYRSMAAEAGQAYGQIFEFEIPYWPFTATPSPFLDDPLGAE